MFLPELMNILYRLPLHISMSSATVDPLLTETDSFCTYSDLLQLCELPFF